MIEPDFIHTYPNTKYLWDETFINRMAYLSSEILQDCCTVHGSCSTHSSMAGSTSLQMPMNTTYRKLEEKIPSDNCQHGPKKIKNPIGKLILLFYIFILLQSS